MYVGHITLTLTDVGITQISRWILVEVRLAQFTVESISVVHTVVTYTAASVTSRVIDSWVKVAAGGVFMAFTSC